MTDASDSNQRAGWEHLFQGGVFPPRFKTSAAPNDSVVEWADTLPAGGSILDVGCGVGRHVVYLGGRGFKMSGMDISPTGIKTTGEACAERQIEFDGRVSDMLALPWAAGTFDAVVSTSTVSHHLLADIRRTIGEIRRVLKPGGLFLVDFVHKGGTASYQRCLDQVVAGELVEVEPNTFVDQRDEIDRLDDAFLPHHFCDEAEVYDLMHSFEIIKIWTDFLAADTPGELPKRGYWVASVRKPLG
ncbi:MAG TPA: class I SAM-dependent methyltransferase [Phototrophicaceae bacterium]|jgi:SAM-dependent methyltransferase|nr:class I SAM-dependent methyltransferase [Phototrophicaceae bacterium]